MKHLIVGLGNPGPQYLHTRHNAGFLVADLIASKNNTSFQSARLADHASFRLRGHSFHLIKPTTFMNLSGRAVKYWMDKLSIPPESILVITDDVALTTGQLRLRAKGSDGGHNGLKSINEHLGTTEYPRLRIGIGNDFPRGGQSDYVLGKWEKEEWEIIEPRIEVAAEAAVESAIKGLENVTSIYNKR